MPDTARDSGRPSRPLPIAATVQSTHALAENLVRIVVHRDDWSTFGEPAHADSYVKLLFLSPGVDYPRPIDPTRIRADMPAANWPRLRTYTVRAFDRDRGTLTLDIVTHGTAGLAGPWARTAEAGDEVLLSGPGGGYTPDPAADWHLLVGDESALPAIAVALERLPADAHATAFLEVEGADDEIELSTPPGAEVHWLHRAGDPVGSRIVPAVTSWSIPSGTGHSFVHGEAGFVRDLRRHLKVERQIPLDQLSISGYWRLGADDEAWRESKRSWNQAIEQSEADVSSSASLA